MEQCENIYVNKSKINRANTAAFSSTCMNTCNEEDNARISKSQIRKTGSKESDRLKFCKRVMGLLFAILLACLIALTIKYRADSTRLQTDYNKCIDDKENFTRHYNNLSIERDRLENSEKVQIKKNQQLQMVISNAGCPTRWRNFLNHLYCVSTKTLTWNESRQSCMEKGAYLVTINSKEEQEFVANLNANAWIGLTNSQTQGVWTWVDNTKPIHKYWMKGEPNNVSGKENCVEMINTMTKQENWNDLSCDKRQYYICEFEY